MRVEIHVFTPNEAKEILANHNNNNPRTIRQSTVKKYIRDMQNGKWMKTWDAIAFDKDGNLMNGQHRLLAIVKTGISCEFLVIYGADGFTGDCGLKRTASEEIRARGGHIDDFTATNFGTGVVRAMYKWYFGIHNCNPTEIEELIQTKCWDECVAVAQTLNRAPKGVKTANVAAGMIGAWLITRDRRIFEFGEVLSSGMAQNNTHAPIIALRDYLQRTDNSGNGRRRPFDKDLIYTQSAIRSFLNGSQTKRLYKSDEIIYAVKWDMLERIEMEEAV